MTLPVVLFAQARPCPQAQIRLGGQQGFGGSRAGQQPARQRGRVRCRDGGAPAAACPGRAFGLDAAGDRRQPALIDGRGAHGELDQGQGLVRHRLAEGDRLDGGEQNPVLALGVVVVRPAARQLELITAVRKAHPMGDAHRILRARTPRQGRSVLPRPRGGPRHVDRAIAHRDRNSRVDQPAVILLKMQARRQEEIEAEAAPIRGRRSHQRRRAARRRLQLLLEIQLVDIVGIELEGARARLQMLDHPKIARPHGADQGVADLDLGNFARAVVDAQDAVQPDVVAFALGKGLHR